MVLFGGDHFDYAMSDTWIYDPTEGTWRQVFPPRVPPARWGASLVVLEKSGKLALVGGTTIEPRFHYFQPRDLPLADVWLFDAEGEAWSLLVRQEGKGGFDWPIVSASAASGPNDVILTVSPPGGWPRRYPALTWIVKVEATRVDRKGTEELGVAPGRRTSRAVTLSRSVGGHRVYDPIRDRIYYWTGGHMSDPANAVHTYHPALNRWSIPYVAEIPPGKGLTFNNRPDCRNHTYHNYAFDPASKGVVAAHYAGTSIYDPDTGTWRNTLQKPYRTSHYTMNLFTTPKGVLVWAEGFFGLFDAASMSYKPLPIKGTFKRYLGPDANGACWDPKHRVLWLFSRTGWKTTDGQVHAYHLETGRIEAKNPTNASTLGRKAFYLREIVYLPKDDLLLTKDFLGKGKTARQIAYDPKGNRWVHLNIHPIGRVTGPVAMAYDTRRDLVWCLSGNRLVYVLKVDPERLEASDRLP